MDKIKRIFADEKIYEVGFSRSDDFSYIYKHLMPDAEIRGAVVFLIPYYYKPVAHFTGISKYAKARDYHIYASELYSRVTTRLEDEFPGERFIGFCDSSPINEKLAAAYAGLGIIGSNSLLISRRYGSYCFIGSLLTTYMPAYDAHEISRCENCGRCVKACPVNALEHGYPDCDKCLSAVSQKKKRTNADFEILRKNGIVWGCDICQDVCPHNQNIGETPVEFFRSDLIDRLDSDLIMKMSDDDFAKRAFSWRGRKIIAENITNIELNTSLRID